MLARDSGCYDNDVLNLLATGAPEPAGSYKLSND